MTLLEQHTQAEIDKAVDQLLSGTTASTDKSFVHPNDRTIDEKLLMLAPQLKTNKPGQIIHETIDKLKKQDSRREEKLVTAFCKWFKLQYRHKPYLVISKEQKRSMAAQNVLLAQSFCKGDMDWLCMAVMPKIRGLGFEFKDAYETLFTVDGKLKPGPNGHFYQQDDYHAIMAKELVYVTFVWDLQQGIDLTNQAFTGTLPKRPVYERSKPSYDYQRILV